MSAGITAMSPHVSVRRASAAASRGPSNITRGVYPERLCIAIVSHEGKRAPFDERGDPWLHGSVPHVDLHPGVWALEARQADPAVVVTLEQGGVVLGTAAGEVSVVVSLLTPTRIDALPDTDTTGLTARRQRTVGTESGVPPAAHSTARLATDGYWGTSARDIITDWQVPQRIVGLSRGMLLAQGRPGYLYLPVGEDETPAGYATRTSLARPPVLCTCVKDARGEGPQADRTCRTCGGTRFSPGFVRHMHQTLWFSSADVAYEAREGSLPPGLDGLTLTDVALDRGTRPFRLVLESGALTGTARFEFRAENPTGQLYAERLDAYTRSPSQSVTVTYERAGAPATLADLAAAAPGETLAAVVELTRDDAEIQSPEFEVLRLRRVRVEHENEAIVYRRRGRTIMGNRPGLILASPTGQFDEFPEGALLFLRPQEQATFQQDAARGGLIEDPSARTWTTPLDFFDTALTPETREVLIPDQVVEPPFVEWTYGAHAGIRHALADLTYSEQNLLVARQSFIGRRLQEDEPQNRWW